MSKSFHNNTSLVFLLRSLKLTLQNIIAVKKSFPAKIDFALKIYEIFFI